MRRWWGRGARRRAAVRGLPPRRPRRAGGELARLARTPAGRRCRGRCARAPSTRAARGHIRTSCCPQNAKCNYRYAPFQACSEAPASRAGIPACAPEGAHRHRGRHPGGLPRQLGARLRAGQGGGRLHHARPHQLRGPTRNPAFRECGDGRCTTSPFIEHCYPVKPAEGEAACLTGWTKVCLQGRITERCLPLAAPKTQPAPTSPPARPPGRASSVKTPAPAPPPADAALRRIDGVFAPSTTPSSASRSTSALRPTDFSKEDRDFAIAVWSDRVQTEYRSVQIMTRFLTEVLGAGDPLDVYAGAVDAIADEVRHTALCAAVVTALGASRRSRSRRRDREPGVHGAADGGAGPGHGRVDAGGERDALDRVHRRPAHPPEPPGHPRGAGRDAGR
ncbi:MAG: hypothetical protein R3F43_00605 [bacterium]